MNKYYKDKNFAAVYKKLLNDLLNSPEFICEPRGIEINEITNIQFEIENPIESLYENIRRSSQFKYIAAELVWYFSKSNDLKFIEKYAKFWKNISNADNTLNSAYGNLIFNTHNNVNQWQWAFNMLSNDKDSRQAILHFNMPMHQYKNNKDFVCTMYGIFQIRNNKLNFTINMRSNDVILGLPTDIAFFCILQQQMLKLLNKTYPNLTLGTYTHIANSLHLYKKHFELVNGMLENDFNSIELKLDNENLIDEYSNTTNVIKQIDELIRLDKINLLKSNDKLINWIIYNIS